MLMPLEIWKSSKGEFSSEWLFLWFIQKGPWEAKKTAESLKGIDAMKHGNFTDTLAIKYIQGYPTWMRKFLNQILPKFSLHLNYIWSENLLSSEGRRSGNVISRRKLALGMIALSISIQNILYLIFEDYRSFDLLYRA